MRQTRLWALMAMGLTLGAASAQADLLLWMGAEGPIPAATSFSEENWYNDTSDFAGDAPQGGNVDSVNVGAGGTVQYNNFYTDGFTVVRVGHNLDGDPAQGVAGTGTVNHIGGDLIANSFMHIGEGNAGEYNLSGSLSNEIIVNSVNFHVGFTAMGTLNQSGGTITANAMNLGQDSLGSGFLDLSAGVIDVNGVFRVGNFGAGQVDQSNGSITADLMHIATEANSMGTYNMTGGSVDVAGGLRVGRVGVGVLDMSTGNGVVTADFIAVSDFALSAGSEMLVGGDSQVILDNNDRFIIGWGRNTTTGARSNGTLTMTGGSITMQTTGSGPVADFVVAWGGVATVNLSDGDIDVGNNLVTAIDAAFLNTTPDPDVLTPASNATIHHSGGTLDAVNATLGEGGVSTYNLSGTGALTTTGRLWLAVFEEADSDLNISGGTLNVGTGLAVALRGTATVTQTNGDVNITNNLLIGDSNLGGDGTYNISGGTLDTGLDIIVGFLPGGTTQGSGELRVTGNGSAINVGQNFISNVDGTLVSEIGSNGLLTEILVTGNATFADGTTLEADFSNYAFSAGEFWDVLTAANIFDNGINLIAPAGIDYQIVNGGQTLQLFVTSVIPTPAAFPAGLVLIALAAVRRRRMG